MHNWCEQGTGKEEFSCVTIGHNLKRKRNDKSKGIYPPLRKRLRKQISICQQIDQNMGKMNVK